MSMLCNSLCSGNVQALNVVRDDAASASGACRICDDRRQISSSHVNYPAIRPLLLACTNQAVASATVWLLEFQKNCS